MWQFASHRRKILDTLFFDQITEVSTKQTKPVSLSNIENDVYKLQLLSEQGPKT